MVARRFSVVTPAAVRLDLTRSQSCSKRLCSGSRIRPSPKRRTANGAPIPNPRSSRNSLGTVSCPFSPILVVVMYSRGVLWVDMVGRNILPQNPTASKHEAGTGLQRLFHAIGDHRIRSEEHTSELQS